MMTFLKQVGNSLSLLVPCGAKARSDSVEIHWGGVHHLGTSKGKTTCRCRLICFNFLQSFLIVWRVLQISQHLANGQSPCLIIIVVFVNWEVPVIVFLHHVSLLQCASRLAFQCENFDVLIKRSSENQRFVSNCDILDRANYVCVSCPLLNLDDFRFVDNSSPSSDRLCVIVSHRTPTPFIVPAMVATVLLFHLN